MFDLFNCIEVYSCEVSLLLSQLTFKFCLWLVKLYSSCCEVKNSSVNLLHSMFRDSLQISIQVEMSQTQTAALITISQTSMNKTDVLRRKWAGWREEISLCHSAHNIRANCWHDTIWETWFILTVSRARSRECFDSSLLQAVQLHHVKLQSF